MLKSTVIALFRVLLILKKKKKKKQLPQIIGRMSSSSLSLGHIEVIFVENRL
jgi:hypothetical protein